MSIFIDFRYKYIIEIINIMNYGKLYYDNNIVNYKVSIGNKELIS